MVCLLCKNIKNFWNKTWNNIQAKYANHKEGFRRFFQELERQNVNIQLVMKSRNGPWEFMQLPRRWQRLQLPVATILFEVMSRSGDKNRFKLAQLCRDGASGTIGDVGNPEKNMMKQILKRWWIMMNHWNCFFDHSWSNIYTNSTFSSGVWWNGFWRTSSFRSAEKSVDRWIIAPQLRLSKLESCWETVLQGGGKKLPPTFLGGRTHVMQLWWSKIMGG